MYCFSAGYLSKGLNKLNVDENKTVTAFQDDSITAQKPRALALERGS